MMVLTHAGNEMLTGIYGPVNLESRVGD